MKCNHLGDFWLIEISHLDKNCSCCRSIGFIINEPHILYACKYCDNIVGIWNPEKNYFIWSFSIKIYV